MANLIRIAVVAEKLGGIHESHAWRKLGADPSAPKPIRLGARHTVFDEGERLCNLFSVNFRVGGHDVRVTG